MARRRVTFVLVDDDAEDRALIAEAFTLLDQPPDVVVLPDGDQLLTALRTRPPAGRARADVVLLDLDLGGVSGLDLLTSLRADPALRRLPVVVLTNSNAPDDVAAAYERGANSYVIKPDDLDGLVEAARTLHRYWADLVEIP